MVGTPQIHNIHRLSFLQEGLLFHTVENPDAAFYVDLVIYRLYGDLDLRLFTRAWEMVAERHAVLRTSFHWRGIKELVQVVHDQVKVPVETLDWRHRPAATRDDDLEAFVRERRTSGFDLERPPLMRITVIRYADEEYRFCFGYHHILLDAWSGLMVLEEALSYYDEMVAGRTPEVVPAPAFHEYVNWVRSQDLDAAERFWRARLAGLNDPPALPIIGQQAGASTSTSMGEHPERVAWIPAETVRHLEQLGRSEQLTLSALIQGCWAVLLHSYTGADDVVFGGTISSRPAEVDGATRTAGLFINSLPLRIRIAPTESILEVGHRVQRELTAIRRYDFSPLAQVQQWSETPAGQPLFDTLTTVLNVPGIGALHRRDGAISLQQGSYRYRTNYPLSLLVIPEDDRIALRVGFDPTRLHADDVERLLAHLLSIITTLAEEPQRPVAEVSLVTGEERQRLQEWGGSTSGHRGQRLPHELIEEVVDEAPHRVAVRHGAEELSYTELDARANQLAHHLRACGVEPDSPVALCLPRSIELIVAQLAILKSGGCFLPLDPSQPGERLQAMLDETQARCLVTTRDWRARLPRTGGHTVLIDTHADRIAQRPMCRLDPVATPSDLAYLMYTSGSTGRPKGVQIPHSGMAHLLQAQRRCVQLDPRDRVLQWAAATFDAQVWEICLALGAGAALHVADAERVVPGDELVSLLRTEGVTALTITPSALAALGSEPAEQLPDLRLLVLAGEALPAELVRRWSRPGRRILNAYGPTETTVCATVADLTGPPAPAHEAKTTTPAGAAATMAASPGSTGSPPGSTGSPPGSAGPTAAAASTTPHSRQPTAATATTTPAGTTQEREPIHVGPVPPIGTPLPGVCVRVLDACGQPVPIGVPGRLYVGGAGLARGYVNQPEQTAERFGSHDPFANGTAERLYRTGDRVRWRSDGQLEFCGRVDRQFKVRGFRIEAGEVEAVLRAQHGVADCAVLAHATGPSSEDGDTAMKLPDTLTAYVVPDASAPAVDDLRAALAHTLPEHMLPGKIITLEQLPLTTNGKLDERALPTSAEEHAGSPPTTDRASTVAEEAVIRLWSEVLGISGIGVDDDFFELGGNSIKATQVVSRVRRIWGVDLPLRSLFEARTVTGFAGVLQEAVSL